MKYLSIALTLLVAVSCGQKPENSKQTPVINVSDLRFGEDFSHVGAISTAKLVTEIPADSDVQTVVTGEVVEVCPKAGCWMRVAIEGSSETVLVNTNHDFELPRDLAGKRVVISGVAYQKLITVDEQKHYAVDAGATPEQIAAITADKQGIMIEAKGVKLLL